MGSKKKKNKRSEREKDKRVWRVEEKPKDIKFPEYMITNQKVDDERVVALPAEIRSKINDLRSKISFTPGDVIPELLKLIEGYPHIPLFYNYLSNAYLLIGDMSKAEETIVECYNKFPEYLFAKVGYANVLLKKGEGEKVPDIFEDKTNLRDLYPERDVFHISEFIAFTDTVVRYFLFAGQIDLAIPLFEDLKKVAPYSPSTMLLEQVISSFKPSVVVSDRLGRG
jgi:tetratricopeptide (TPR) repeat protein